MLKKTLITLWVTFFLCTGTMIFAQENTEVKEFMASGDQHLKAGRFAEAISDYNQVVELDPGLAIAYNNRGLAKYKSKDEQSAIGDFDKAIQLDSENLDSYYNRGLAKYAFNDFSGAISDFSHVIGLDEKDKDAYYMRGLSKTYIEGIEKEDYCADFQRAKELGHPTAQGAILRYCSEED